MMALCLAREDAVEGWREMLGPKEIQEAAEQAPDRYSELDIRTYHVLYKIYCDSGKSLHYTLHELNNNSYFCPVSYCEV